jgi:hypothetical protein
MHNEGRTSFLMPVQFVCFLLWSYSVAVGFFFFFFFFFFYQKNFRAALVSTNKANARPTMKSASSTST